MQDKFGVTIVKKSFRELGEQARAIPDAEAEAAWRSRQVPTRGLTPRNILSALKVYLAVQRHLEADPQVEAVGINCLNESRFSDTVPCLTWNLLYEECQMIWGCEADIVSMLTKYILHKSLGMPIMMTNLYPFLMGQAALKHERISHFPDVPDPDDHILAAHCGYLGVLPQSFATEWQLVPKVLAIVDENSAVIDARLAEGPMTLAKLDPGFERFTVAEGSLEGYVQYPGSDCRNGAVLRVANGRRMLGSIASHHYLLMTGHQQRDIELVGKAFELELETL
jgi:L-fucose isomerase-like protein